MTSRFRATRLQQAASLVRFALPDALAAVLCMAGVALAVIAAALLA